MERETQIKANPDGNYFPLASTVTRERGTVSKAQALSLLANLTSHFGTSLPRLKWSNTRGGTYYVGGETIAFGPNSYRGVDVLLHEFAHHLQKTEKYAALSTGGTVSRKWNRFYGEFVEVYRRSIHGKDFIAALEDVVRFAYGDLAHYSWDREYRSIAKQYRRRYGATTSQKNQVTRQDPRPVIRRPYSITLGDRILGQIAVAAAPRKNVAAALDAKAAKARRWTALVKEIERLDGTIPPKGTGWTAAVKDEARRLGIADMIPGGKR